MGEARLNRIAVDVVEKTELGGLCVDCEHEHFGIHSGELGTEYSECCLLCDRDATWALPMVENSVRSSANGDSPKYTYDITSANLILCDYHFRLVASIPLGNSRRGLFNQPPLTNWTE